MQALIVYAHPEPSSFSAALKDVAVETLRQAGAEVDVSDLYEMNFDPVAGRDDFTTVRDPLRFHYQSEQQFASAHNGYAPVLAREQEKLLRADLLIPIFPLWHGGMPAILKGWFERVCAYGVIYFDRRRFKEGLFVGRRAIIGMSTGGTAERFSPEGVYGDMSVMLHNVQRGLIEYLGFEALAPFVAYAAPRVEAEQRQAYLATWAATLRAITEDTGWRAELADRKSAALRGGATEASPWTVRD